MAYPFSRIRRIEFAAGYRHLSFSNELVTRTITTVPPNVTVDDEVNLGAPESVHLGETSAALVYDNALFGATGPVRGQRYRFEVSRKFGGLNYTGTRVDFRRYFMPVKPYTLAGRILQVGRFGPDSEDPRLGDRTRRAVQPGCGPVRGPLPIADARAGAS